MKWVNSVWHELNVKGYKTQYLMFYLINFIVFCKHIQSKRLTRQTTKHVSTMHHSTSDHLNSRDLSSNFELCWHITSTVCNTVSAGICGCSNRQCLLTVSCSSVSNPMWWQPSQKHAGFQCGAVCGIEGHIHSVVAFGLVFHAWRFLPIPWNFWYYYTLQRIQYLETLQSLNKKCCF